MSQQVQTQNKRLFLALWPEETVVRKIKQHAIKHFSACQGRVLDKHNWHITLAYFGASDATTQACIEKQVAKIKAQAFELSLSQCGFWKKPAVAWIAPAVIPAELMQLALDVQQSLVACGYKPEERAYQPHVTLVRKAKRVPAVKEIQAIAWRVTSFCLVESKTYPQGAEYKVIKEYIFSHEEH